MQAGRVHSISQRTALACLALSLLAWPVFSPELHVDAAHKPAPAPQQDWSAYNGGVNGRHFSGLTQIDKSNVHLLRQVWRFDAGADGGLQTNPLIAGHTLYGYTSALQVVALDAATGKQLWKFDSGVTGGQPSRGFNLWVGPNGEKRLFAYIMNFLYALDPSTGKPIATFGDGGRIDMRKDLGNPYEENNVAMTTPGVLYKDLLISGFRTNEVKPAPHGDIRAYNVVTGKLAWSFHTIPHPGEEGYKTWPDGAWKDAGAANNWPSFALDEQRGIVFAPTGSAVPDFYGAERVGDDLYANCLLALDAATGKKLWHFQGVHHDVWDRDFPSPPALVTVRHDGQLVDAVAQTSKQGFVFLFDRVTGKPLFPIEERPYPASDVPGEVTSPTQPLPLAPEPYARQRVTADSLTNRSPEAHAWAVEEFKKMRSDGQFIPLTVGKQTIVFPGFDGGGEWGGPAVDPQKGILYVNASEMAWLGGLVEAPRGGTPGAQLYQSQCAMCHGADRKGNPPAFPALDKIFSTMPAKQVAETIRGGKGRMPSNPNLAEKQVQSLLDYLHSDVDPAASSAAIADSGGKDPAGAKIYARNCAICHGDDRMGAPYFPSLFGVRSRLTDEQTLAVIHMGKGRMPAFTRISESEMAALFRFLGAPPVEVAADKKELTPETPPAHQDRYNFTGYRKFLDPDGYPAVSTPWGTLNAIDLNTGKYLWKIPFGYYPELAAKGMDTTGTENYGGPVLTASGVLFIGATIYDRKLRAFDAQNGKLLWQTDLPYAGNATPATYTVDGKQFLVIATSGLRDRKGPQGAAYVAFALP